MNQRSSLIVLAAILLFSLPLPADAQHPKTNTRVFWIDRDTQKLSWGDIVTTDKWSLKRGSVEGFPQKTESQVNRLGPLYERNGLVVAGISGIQDDKQKGRWVAIDAGVYQEPHGNHFHWKYTGRPAVTQTIVEDRQGATARVSSSGDQLYLLGDHGYFAANLNNLRIRGTTQTSQYFPATDWPVSNLAVVDNAVGYSAWDDSAGKHAGQIDVIKLADSARQAREFKSEVQRLGNSRAVKDFCWCSPVQALPWSIIELGDRRCKLLT